MLLYGGESVGRMLRDVLRFGGDGWELVPTVDDLGDGSPEAVSRLGLGYDRHARRVVLFGGSARAPSDEHDAIWGFDDGEWELLRAEGRAGGPPPLSFPGWCYHPGERRFVLFGGEPDDGVFPHDDYLEGTWLWDGEGWTRSEPEASQQPSALRELELVYDPSRGRTLAYSGYGGSWSRDTLSWDGLALRRHAYRAAQGGFGPTPAYALGSAFVPELGAPVFVGQGYPEDALFVLEEEEWRELVPEDPEDDGNLPNRYRAPLAYVPTDGTLLTFGGEGRETGGSPFVVHGDTRVWNGTSWRLVVPEDPEGDGDPTARAEHALVWDPTRETVLLLGGHPMHHDDDLPPSNGVQWEWTGSSWARVVPEDPEEDGSPGDSGVAESMPHYEVAVDPHRGRVLAVGDSGGDTLALWEWSGTSWLRAAPADPYGDGDPIPMKAMGWAWDAGRGRGVVYGGEDRGGTRPPNLWEWDPGVGRRPAHVFHCALAETERSADAELLRLDVRWTAGGTGEHDGEVADGAVLYVWDEGYWRAAQTDVAAGAGSTSSLAASYEGEALARLPHGPGEWVSFAVAPLHGTGVARRGSARTTSSWS